MLCSAAMRRASGEAVRCPSEAAVVAAGCCSADCVGACVAAGCCSAGCDGACWLVAGCAGVGCWAAASPIIPITSPTPTTSPSFFKICCNTPLSSALTSTLTLSVSSSASTSPFCTCSPSCLSQVAIVASTMDSPIWGTRTSTDISFLFPAFHDCIFAELVYFHGRKQGVFDDLLLLKLEHIRKAGSRAGTCRT